MEIEERIRKDISLFSESMNKASKLALTEEERKVVELAGMYAQDSEAWLKKKDLYTSFSSIAYAHGLMDAILKIKGAYDEDK
ncbi:MAG: DUF357 domain-containing protein [Candidatus Marsarchaeota archaeon]|nr:DUF357 domain-containing protein [Candidatus Marsarchaeota archaeon]